MLKHNVVMKQTFSTLDAAEKRRLNDRIFEIPFDACEDEVLDMRRLQHIIMKEDMSKQMEKVNKLSLALKYEASIAVEEQDRKYKELFTEN